MAARHAIGKAGVTKPVEKVSFHANLASVASSLWRSSSSEDCLALIPQSMTLVRHSLREGG